MSVVRLVVIGTAIDYWITDGLKSFIMILFVLFSLVIVTVVVVCSFDVMDSW